MTGRTWYSGRDNAMTIWYSDNARTLANLRTSGDGTLPAYAWPGGYPIVYYTAAGLMICAQCANDSDTSDPVHDAEVYWEGPTVQCDDGSQCGAMAGGYWTAGLIESAYGDPDEE